MPALAADWGGGDGTGASNYNRTTESTHTKRYNFFSSDEETTPTKSNNSKSAPNWCSSVPSFVEVFYIQVLPLHRPWRRWILSNLTSFRLKNTVSVFFCCWCYSTLQSKFNATFRPCCPHLSVVETFIIPSAYMYACVFTLLDCFSITNMYSIVQNNGQNCPSNFIWVDLFHPEALKLPAHWAKLYCGMERSAFHLKFWGCRQIFFRNSRCIKKAEGWKFSQSTLIFWLHGCIQNQCCGVG